MSARHPISGLVFLFGKQFTKQPSFQLLSSTLKGQIPNSTRPNLNGTCTSSFDTLAKCPRNSLLAQLYLVISKPNSLQMYKCDIPWSYEILFRSFLSFRSLVTSCQFLQVYGQSKAREQKEIDPRGCYYCQLDLAQVQQSRFPFCGLPKGQPPRCQEQNLNCYWTLFDLEAHTYVAVTAWADLCTSFRALTVTWQHEAMPVSTLLIRKWGMSWAGGTRSLGLSDWELQHQKWLVQAPHSFQLCNSNSIWAHW